MNDLKKQFKELNKYERKLYNDGKLCILGIDEVGRGPLAGPLVVGGVILDPKQPIYGLNDSKKLSRKKREILNQEIREQSVAFAISSISAKVIDKVGMSQALNLAIKRVIKKIEKKTKIDFILFDYVKFKTVYPNDSLIKGDQKSNSIAAASIIAKVYRDNYMYKLAYKYPAYGFATNVGYGTLEHRKALEKFGYIDNVHRKSFEPIKSMGEYE